MYEGYKKNFLTGSGSEEESGSDSESDSESDSGKGIFDSGSDDDLDDSGDDVIVESCRDILSTLNLVRLVEA